MKSSTKYIKILVNYLFMAGIIFICIYVIPKVLAFFLPFVIAGIIAAIANPLVRFLENKLKIKRKAGTIFVIILTLALVAAACYGVIYLLVTEIVGFITSAPDMWNKLSQAIRSSTEYINTKFARMPMNVQNYFVTLGEGIYDSLSDAGSSIGERAAESAGRGVKNAPLALVGTIMAILASYLFVAERDYLGKISSRIVPKHLMERVQIITSTMKSAVGGYFKAQFKIMLFVYVVLLGGFFILKVKYAFLIALIVALLDFLPFFGTGAVMWPWALYAVIEKDYKFAIGMMIVWGLSQLVRQLIQPKMVGDSIGMGPVPTIFLLYIGFRVAGALGLIIAVPIGMIVYNLYRAGLFSNFFYSSRILIRDLRKLRIFTKDELEAEGIEETSTGAANSEEDNENDKSSGR